MKYFYLILLQPANPCNSIISTVQHSAARKGDKSMNNQPEFLNDEAFGTFNVDTSVVVRYFPKQEPRAEDPEIESLSSFKI